ncbi:DNA topoisomerase IV subunit B, partial [Bacillus pseudomycoides]|nr:DNA topoisomerase IV subunit B [Bacillus pseudomycoides]
FDGQIKGKLGTSEGRSSVDAIVSEQLEYCLEENPDVATLLVRKAIKAAQAREAARKAREEARTGKKKKRSERTLSGKLSP